MPTSAWYLVLGAVMLVIGLVTRTIPRVPLTNAIVFLSVGVIAGPTFLHAYHFNPIQQSGVLETVTEIAVLLSLFTAGVKMPVPFTGLRWRKPILLAVVSMAVTVAVMMVFAHFALALSWGGALLLAAILAPTDPVLATDVQTRHPGDRNRLRFSLTCEAGLNDGTVYPVFMLGLGLLGLHEIGVAGWSWLATDVVWAIGSGFALGLLAGYAVALVIHAVQSEQAGEGVAQDFLALGLIGVTYGVSEMAGALGFLSVFVAAVALRHGERVLSGLGAEPPRLQWSCREAEPRADEAGGSERLTDGCLGFHEKLERIAEVVLVLLLGGSLFASSWSWSAVGIALFLFLVARPVGVWLALLSTRMPRRQKYLTSWFGVRGIGSLYYLMVAIGSGLPEELALQLLDTVLVVVILSILLHGVSGKILMNAGLQRRVVRAMAPAPVSRDGTVRWRA